MILLSHGIGSNLLEHLKETAQSAPSETCRMVFLCHDIGKATVPWQQYIRSPQGKESPHPHAGAGALLAAALLHHAGATPMEELAAMHCIAAHHSALSVLTVTVLNGSELVAGDPQAKAFFLDREEGIASLLPRVSDVVLEKSWHDFRELSNACSDLREEFAERWAEVPDQERLEAYLLAREWLGRLCFYDRLSARKQGKKTDSIPDYEQCFGTKTFQLRPRKQYSVGTNKVYALRNALRSKFLDLVEKGDPLFTFLDAPTGMGKTETMLLAAERIREKSGATRIIYAVPQVSIADQIFEDYFRNAASAQIWNYRRREKTSDDPSETDNSGDRASLLFEAHPFSESYDITTFNQVLLSALHPDRDRCIRNAGLRDAVIIMDEFHKLPMTILPLFFPAARAFAERNHCRFLFGSATPFQRLPYWSLEDAVHLEQRDTAPLYSAPEIDLRREYSSIGMLNVDQLTAEIEKRQTEFPEDNLLAVVNLVGEISWPLRQRFLGGYQPWQDFARQRDLPRGARRIFVLDGLTPPVLRREIVLRCREAMKHGPVTLIATQMVEVGVDLDFDRALCDFQGLASVIQRGGRVGREGRGDGKPCPVEVFALLTSGGERTSFEVLNEVERQAVRDIEPLRKSAENMGFFRQKELRFFSKWQPGVMLHDSDLTEELLKLQQRVFGEERFPALWEKFFLAFADGHQRLGCTFEYAHFIAEIGGDSYGEELIVVPTCELCSELSALDEKISGNRSSFAERTRYRQLLSDHRIVVNPSLREELGLSASVLLKNPDLVKMFVMESFIL